MFKLPRQVKNTSVRAIIAPEKQLFQKTQQNKQQHTPTDEQTKEQEEDKHKHLNLIQLQWK